MKPPKRQRKSTNKAQTTQRSAAKRQKTLNYVENQTANASDGTADHAVLGPSVSRDGSSSTTQNPSSSRVDTIPNTENQSRGASNMDKSDLPTRTDPGQQRGFRPSTGAIANPESNTSDNTTVSYSGVNTPGGLPTQPFQSGLTSSGHTSQNVQQLGTFTNNTPVDSHVVHISSTPNYTTSVFDPISEHIPQKIKEKIWAGEYVDLSLLLKSAKDLFSESHLTGNLQINGGQISVVQQKQSLITNIHVWTSAFMVFMDVLLQKWPNHGQELLKYMHTIRLASSRGSGLGWVSYDEQYRLRKARSPQSSWASIDMELWVLYVSTPPRSTSFNSRVQDQLPQGLGPQPLNQNLAQNNQRKSGSYPFRACWSYNRGKCDFGSRCRFAHKCSKCSGEHPVKTCRAK